MVEGSLPLSPKHLSPLLLGLLRVIGQEPLIPRRLSLGIRTHEGRARRLAKNWGGEYKSGRWVSLCGGESSKGLKVRLP